MIRLFGKKDSSPTGKKREKQNRYLSQAIQLEESVNPHIVRSTMAMTSAALLAFLVWAAFTNINEVARTPGEVVPDGYQQTVQHLEGGIVKTINVKEGQQVKTGDLLVALNDASIQEDMQRARSKDLSLRLQAERLRAFVENREPDFSIYSEAPPDLILDQVSFFKGMRLAREKEEALIHDQITQKKQAIHSLKTDLETAKQNLSIARDIYSRRSKLNQQGYASTVQLLENKKEVNELAGSVKRLENQILVAESEIVEAENKLSSLSARQRDESYEKLALVEADISQNREVIDKLQERIDRMSIRAPTDGFIKGISVNTIGAVVRPGDTLMEIVPQDKQLEVAVKISPKDIGHLKLGQKVQVKFSTYDFSRYGFVQGTLDYISATTFTVENDERYYQGRVLLNQDYVGGNPDNIILPGMTVMADVITGEKTILQYLLKPIHISLRTAFTER